MYAMHVWLGGNFIDQGNFLIQQLLKKKKKLTHALFSKQVMQGRSKNKETKFN